MPRDNLPATDPAQTFGSPVDGVAMLDEVHAFLGRFVAYPCEHTQVAHVLWIVHTHLMSAWESTPRLAFLSPEPGSGKTRALEVSELLVPRPIEAVNMSPSALFRLVQLGERLPTILYDEVDTIFGAKRTPEGEAIRGLINAGHRRGAKTYRTIMNGKQANVEEIEAYSAVALAGLGDLPDTLMSRSIVVRMQRRAPGERVEPYRRRVHAPEGEALRDRIASWAAVAVDSITIVWPEMPAEVEDRDADVWEPLLAVADAAGGDWPARARAAAIALVAQSKEREGSLGVKLLADLHEVFGSRDAMSTADILEALNALPESPWADVRGKPLNDRGLSRRLANYGIKPKSIRTGHRVLRGYGREDLHDAWLRYVPSLLPRRSATNATSATNPEFRGLDVAHVADRPATTATSEAQKSADVADVADVADLAAMEGDGRRAARGEGRKTVRAGLGELRLPCGWRMRT